jgi:hypothetical protein
MNLYRLLRIERLPNKSRFNILKRLTLEGHLENNRHLDMKRTIRVSDCRFVKLFCSMKNLETLDLLFQELTLEDLANVFQSCSKLVLLCVATRACKTLDMAEHLKNQLRAGFQRLRYLYLEWLFYNDSRLVNHQSPMVIQEMLT